MPPVLSSVKVKPTLALNVPSALSLVFKNAVALPVVLFCFKSAIFLFEALNSALPTAIPRAALPVAPLPPVIGIPVVLS